MGWVPRLVRLLACAVAAGALACPAPSTPGDSRVPVDEPAPDSEAAADADAETTAGPITLVVPDIAFTQERLCDFDGDGVGDNAIADLGEPAAGLFAASMNSVLHGFIDEGMRLVVHFPWVDDIATPDDSAATMIMFFGGDGPEAWDPSDDFSGSARLYAFAESLDACGEPLHVLRTAAIAQGLLSAEGGTFPAPLPGVTGRAARASGTIAPAGASAEIQLCGYLPVQDLGGAPGYELDLTLLEMILAGGAPQGIAEIHGLTPDVDLDGDGLERFVLDEAWHVSICLDGDGTTSGGRDCWAADEMADAFAATLVLEAVSASFAGRHPAWQVGSACEAGMPEQSLFDPP